MFDDQQLNERVNECLDRPGDYNLARLLKYISGNKIVYSKRWYHFDGKGWMIDKGNVKVRDALQDEIKVFEAVASNYSGVLMVAAYRIIKKLQSDVKKRNIIKAAECYFEDTEFECKLNRRKNIIPFTNGVYDLNTREFRETRADDYVEITVEYEYNREVSEGEVWEFVEKILPKSEVREYVLKKMAQCLTGNIKNKLMMFNGEGANGKTQLLELMRMTMGGLGVKVEASLINGKKTASMFEERTKLKNKRFAWLSKPEYGERINNALLNDMVEGNGELIAKRGRNDKNFEMEASLYMECNRLPEVRTTVKDDYAVWRRIAVVEFESKFVQDPEKELEFRIDERLPIRMLDISWRQAFMNVLIRHYDEKVEEPGEVERMKELYRKRMRIGSY